ncbi:MAG: SPOR domain-containing protein [Treponemataceae bacterium]
MEQKKLLLVLVSVGVFLVIVLGAGILVFKPRAKPIPSGPVALAPAANTQGPASADPAEWVRNPKAMPGLQSPASAGASNRGDVIIIYGERPNGGAPLTNATQSPTPNAAISADGSLKVDVAVPQTNELAPIAPQSTANDTIKQVASAVKAPPPTVKSEKDPAVKATATVKKTASHAQKAASRREEFWIQTGSFAAKARADTAKETLGVKGIASLVETKEISGKTYFRVRVGPYSSKNEADYWLSLVKTIDGFDGSYVSQLKSKR